jgi:E3 ubiquitin-protein ligase HECTD1
MRIKLTHYSIRTRRDYNGHHLRDWILEGSNDGLSWVELDRRRNDTSLNSQGGIATFSISNGSEEEFQQIRLCQTGKNSSGYDHLVLNAIEFFGVVKSRKQ